MCFFFRCYFQVGHVLISVNGLPVNGSTLEDGRNVKDILDSPADYPLTLKFTRPKMTTNEKIFLASMFYPLFAIASQLSPEPKSSGIEILEADTFKLQCFQTLTGTWFIGGSVSILQCLIQLVFLFFYLAGVKFMVVSETTQMGIDVLLRRIYELYADYALKNPFYSLEMPIRCELFETNLQALLEQMEKGGVTNI